MHVLDYLVTNFEHRQRGHLRERYLWGPAVDHIAAIWEEFPLPRERARVRAVPSPFRP